MSSSPSLLILSEAPNTAQGPQQQGRTLWYLRHVLQVGPRLTLSKQERRHSPSTAADAPPWLGGWVQFPLVHSAGAPSHPTAVPALSNDKWLERSGFCFLPSTLQVTATSQSRLWAQGDGGGSRGLPGHDRALRRWEWTRGGGRHGGMARRPVQEGQKDYSKRWFESMILAAFLSLVQTSTHFDDKKHHNW